MHYIMDIYINHNEGMNMNIDSTELVNANFECHLLTLVMCTMQINTSYNKYSNEPATASHRMSTEHSLTFHIRRYFCSL